MGFNISYAAFCEIDSCEVLSFLGLEEGPVPEFFLEEPLVGGMLESGWYCIFSNDPTAFGVDEWRAKNAWYGQAVAAAALETTMMSRAIAFDDRTPVWQVTHEGDQGVRHLNARGELPANFGEIVAAAEKAQDEEDRGLQDVDVFFDVPIELVTSIIGFQYNRRNTHFEKICRTLRPVS